MDRLELKSRWNGYCKKFIAQEPANYAEQNAVFAADKGDFPEETQKFISGQDWLEKLTFCGDKSALGPWECNPKRIAELTEFLRQDSVKMAFDYEVGKSGPVHIVRKDSVFAGRDIWFIGDIHGDLLAFESAIAFINSNSRCKPIYVFLGDLFDRNDFGLNVILEVVTLFKNNPDSVFMIAGNHDDGLARTGDNFSSTVTPQQFTEYLNAIDDAVISSFVEEFTKVIKKMPVGLVLPNGLFATHGGVPTRPERSIKNVWEGKNPQEIKEYIAIKRGEFQRNRFNAEVSTGTKTGNEYSWVEIINFSKAMELAYGVTISVLLCGHDHGGLSRHAWYKSNFKGSENCSDPERVQNVLNMTSMVLMADDEKRLSSFAKHETSFPSIARYDNGTPLPKVYSLEFDNNEVKDYYESAHKILGEESFNYVEKSLVKCQDLKTEIQEDLEDNQEILEKKMAACEGPKNDLDKLNQEVENIEKNIKTAEIDVKLESDKIVELEKQKEKEETIAANVLDKIKDVEAKIETKQSEVDACEKMIEQGSVDEQSGWALIKAKVSEFFFGKKKTKKVKSFEELKNIDDAKKLEAAKMALDCFKKELAGLQGDLDRECKECQRHQDAINEIEVKQNESKTLLEKKKARVISEQKKFDGFKSSLCEANQKYNEVQAALNTYESKVQQNKNELADVEKQISALNAKAEQFKKWATMQG